MYNDQPTICLKIELTGPVSGKALTPFKWIASSMEHGVDRSRVLLMLVENSIWKSTHQRAAIPVMNE
jgi:hypothetical protein